MLVKMKCDVFETLKDRALVWACIEPTILKIRGKSPDVKTEVYKSLTAGQQALMLFQVFYGHTRSAAEFYWFACDYLSEARLWEKMKEGLRLYNCAALLNVYGEIEVLLHPKLKFASDEGRKISVLDLDHDPTLLTAVIPLYEKYRSAASDAVTRIASAIRSTPEEYVELVK